MKKYLLFLSLLLIGCGSRKVEKQSKIEEIKTETKDIVKNDLTTEKNVLIENKTFTDEKTGEEIEETIFTPIDNNKESIVTDEEGNKTTLNNSTLTKRKIKRYKALISNSNTNAKANEKSTDKTTKTSKKTQSDKKNESNKRVERKESLLSYWWVIVIIILVAFFYKRLKNKLYLYM